MATKYQNYIAGDDGSQNIYWLTTTNLMQGQSFTVATAHKIVHIKVKVYRVGSPGVLTAQIYNVTAGQEYYPIGSPLCSGTYDADTLTTDTNGEWITITLGDGYNLAVSGVYAIVLSAYSGDSSNRVCWRFDNSSPTFTGGRRVQYTAANAWQHDSTDDMMFEEWGDPVTVIDRTFSKKLVEVGNNEVWYESATNILSELLAANGDIDTLKPLTIVEAFEKVFIANGANLKVIDFGNTKIQTDDIKDEVAGANDYPDNATVVTGAGGAEMVIDYITAIDGAAVIYGKKINDTAFVNGELVSGVNADGTIVKFDIKAGTTEVIPIIPHWYDWTVYGNSSIYGVMPTQANKVFRYQGRVGLTCDKDYPHQWYLPRPNNPWDWNYITTGDDTQSPIAGEDAEAGQAGDIIITAIPYNKDYLIFACANSLQYIVGNPAEGGTMLDLDNGAGILGVRAFCWDNKGNLYILATTGLLRIPNGFGIPENLTEASYPDFIKDLAYDSSLHRIVMGYDRTGHGIKIAKTILASGANSGWWYDLKTEGLFPESYDDTGCGIFSMFHYEAIDPDYNKLLFGCNDGYIRFSDSSSKSDIKADDTNQAIDSYVTFGPLKLGGENREGKINSITGITTGGETGGSVTDSSDIYCRMWTGLSADKIVEKLAANTSPQVVRTITAPGRRRGSQKRQKIRGVFAGIRIGNDTVDEAWGLERLILGASQAGRVK